MKRIKEAKERDGTLQKLRDKAMKGKLPEYTIGPDGILRYQYRVFLPQNLEIKKKVLDEACLSDDSCTMVMATKMKKKFDKYWGDCDLLISLASVLDPRNKMKFIDFAFKELYSNVDVFTHLSNVENYLHTLYGEYFESYKEMVVKK